MASSRNSSKVEDIGIRIRCNEVSYDGIFLHCKLAINVVIISMKVSELF